MSIPGTEMYFCQTICYFGPLTGRHGADMPRCPLNAADGPIMHAGWVAEITVDTVANCVDSVVLRMSRYVTVNTSLKV